MQIVELKGGSVTHLRRACDGGVGGATLGGKSHAASGAPGEPEHKPNPRRLGGGKTRGLSLGPRTRVMTLGDIAGTGGRGEQYNTRHRHSQDLLRDTAPQ